MKRLSKKLLPSLLILLVLILCLYYFISYKKAVVLSQQILVPGLLQPVDILIDRYGVPHIYAANEDDAFFAQGFNVARDRLFQIDLSRRRGLGELSEIFGPSYLEQDRAARLFLYRGDMQQEWESYPLDAKRIATQFISGINAYIDLLTHHPELVPFEFKKFNYFPAKWSADDVVRIRSHVLTHNLLEEIMRAHVTCLAGLDVDVFRTELQPPWTTQIPQELDPCLPEDILTTMTLATNKFEYNPDAALHDGSNAWVISPEKSATGRAILASDPHRAYSIPSLRYITHLHTPTFNIIGAGEPGLPAVSLGHNGTIAFAFTFASIDQEDLYVYELNPNNPREYFYAGQWQPFLAVEESITVRNAQAMPAELLFTQHGPVIYLDQEKQRAYAVRAAWLLPGAAPYFASLGYIHAKNFADFKNAAAHWAAPPSNLVYADVQGNVGWVMAGKAAIRPNWDGLLPVPGAGQYEWAGFWDPSKLPFIYNPEQGYFASANEMNLPEGYPYAERKLGFEWINPFRYQRIDSVLKSLPAVSIENSMQLQNDIFSIPAARLVALLQPLKGNTFNQQRALSLLNQWDFNMGQHSAPAALHEVWFSRHLRSAFKTAILSPTAANTFDHPDLLIMLNVLENPEEWWGDSAVEKRDALLLQSLDAAYEEMIQLQGNDSNTWEWGKLLQMTLEHPLSFAVTPKEKEALNVGPLPRKGSAFTPNQAIYRSRDFEQIHGASVRMIFDIGNWDNTQAINFPGQSGEPSSPHYRDLVALWENGEYFPLLYTRDAIEAETKTKLHLIPADNE